MTYSPALVAASTAISEGSAKDMARLWTDVLAELPLFAGVPKRHVRKIAGLGRQARFHPGSSIVRKGTPGDDFFVIIDGEASVHRSHDLPPIPIGPGAYFGEMSLIDGSERSASVLADTEMLCLRLSRVPFGKMLKSEPEIAIAMLREFAGRIRRLQEERAATL